MHWCNTLCLFLNFSKAILNLSVSLTTKSICFPYLQLIVLHLKIAHEIECDCPQYMFCSNFLLFLTLCWPSHFINTLLKYCVRCPFLGKLLRCGFRVTCQKWMKKIPFFMQMIYMVFAGHSPWQIQAFSGKVTKQKSCGIKWECKVFFWNQTCRSREFFVRKAFLKSYLSVSLSECWKRKTWSKRKTG